MKTNTKRGRKSLGELTAPVRVGEIEIVQRLQPPHTLSDEECEVWVAVTSDRAPDHFSASNSHLLEQYCRHVVEARRIAVLIERHAGRKKTSFTAYNQLLKAQRAETKEIAMLSTKMRLAQQSTTNHRGNKAKHILRPWETE